jgi:hypothetical protein
MRRILYLTTAILMLATACKKNDLDDNTAKPVNLNVTIDFSGDAATLGLPKTSALVKITHNTNGTVKEAQTDASGVASFASITPGTYTITASLSIPKATYTQVSGINVEEDVVFNGNITSQQVIQLQSAITIPLVTGRIGNWVFKQVYYAGSNTSTGAAFRDQFLEVYNNSTETLYADSLCIALVIGVNNTAANYPAHGYLPSNQYDWTKAVGITSANANTNFVYVKSAFMIPGTGKQFPVEPGKSIIIAQTAQNHTAPYTTNNGTVQTITNPALTVNLANADFETYLVDYKKAEATDPATFTPYRWDVDNPAITNMKVIYLSTGSDLLIDNPGRDAIVIYKAADKDPATFPYFAQPTVTAIAPNTVLYQQVPLQYIVDAIELQHANETQRVPKRLPNTLDAGPTNVTGGQYSSQSLVRKTAKTVNGRRILQDTNNSANDFFTKTKADPSKSEASFSN